MTEEYGRVKVYLADGCVSDRAVCIANSNYTEIPISTCSEEEIVSQTDFWVPRVGERFYNMS